MLLSELTEYLLIDTGTFILRDADLSKLRFNNRKLWRLVLTELRKYQDYYPRVEEFNLKLDQHFAFGAEDNGTGVPRGIPTWLSSCTPISLVASSGQFSLVGSGIVHGQSGKYHGPNDPLPWQLRTSVPVGAPWKYEKPHLYMSFVGMVDITACYDYDFVVTNDETVVTTINEVEINGLDLKAGTFLDMIEGQFMTAVGRSRRAFTYQNLPIETDAEALVEEGKEKYERALESLRGRSRWWLAVGK